MRILLFILLLIIGFATSAQNGTKDLIYGTTVKDYIVLIPKFGSPGSVDVQVDRDAKLKTNKSLPEKLTLKMRPRHREMNIMSTFFNPLNYSVTITDSTFTDENFASLGKFMDAVGIMVNTLKDSASDGNSEKDPNKQKDQTPLAYEKANPKSTVAAIKNPDLAEWKFHFKSNRIEKCEPGIKDLAWALYLLDTSFYTKPSLEKAVEAWLKSVKGATTGDDFKNKIKDSVALLEALSAINSADQKNISDLGTFAGRLELKDNADTTIGCAEFAEYTKILMAKIKEGYQAKHVLRTKLLESFRGLIQNCKVFAEKIQDGLVYVGRYPVQEELVHEIKVIFKPKEVTFSNNTINITEGKPVSTNKIYLRASHFLVPEFAVGIAYTNLSYPKFGVDSNNIVTDAGMDDVSSIAASHLNLVVNGFDGPVVPMLQAGVGTGKDRPSLLAGVGLRFLKPKNLSLSYGRLWTWKKMPKTLKVGDKVNGPAALEKDMDFKLDNHSSYYISIQYNF